MGGGALAPIPFSRVPVPDWTPIHVVHHAPREAACPAPPIDPPASRCAEDQANTCRAEAFETAMRKFSPSNTPPLYPVATDNPCWSEESECCSEELMVAAAADWDPPNASTSSLPPGGAGGSPAHLHSGRNFKATAMLYMPPERAGVIPWQSMAKSTMSTRHAPYKSKTHTHTAQAPQDIS
ncbi:hypothetical protein B0T18DRAFT_391966 [Schizothecium vesticola]|uniref:Uncharacterized protein n=1 Tax=Schizothecium vesticola TaxID=314040 RepID=A0AA40K226_9PEZI|nr:hypothetical protein B0T18DRAFT_391966 [Schizothecium vesticola]